MIDLDPFMYRMNTKANDDALLQAWISCVIAYKPSETMITEHCLDMI